METVYNAANAASRALFSKGTNPDSQNPNQSQSRNPNSVTTDTSDRPAVSETNPFRQSGTDNDTNPFRSATGSTTKPFDSTNTSGFGSQHTATSGSGDHEVLNKPYNAGVGSLEKSSARTYDQPSGNDFDKPSTAGVFAEHSSNYESNPASNFDKPLTTTSIFPKTSIGDLNKDGTRHEIGDVERQTAGVHSSNPTISSVHDNSSASSSDYNKPVTSRFSEHTSTPITSIGTGTGVLGGVDASHEHYAPTNRDFSQSSTTDQSSSSVPRHSHDDYNTSGNDNLDSSISRDTTTSHTPHHQSGAPAQGSNIQNLVDPNPATSTSGISSTSKPTSTSNPATTTGAAIHGAANSGIETANAAPKSLTGAIGSGPGAAVEPSVGAHPGHAQQQTQKQQGADRPLDDPSNTSSASTSKGDTGVPKPLGESHHEEESQGTGEKYEKSTGLAAEGGDFDASRPGAGREADRLLDQKGIHHGKETKPDTSNITTGAGHSKLLPGHKDKSHTDTTKDHHHDKQTASPSSDNGSSGHKGLAEKIKEKLHIHH